MPFEQKNKPAKNQAATCRNFKNTCKSLCDRQSYTMVVDIIDNPFRDKLVYHPSIRVPKHETQSNRFLKDHRQLVCCPKSVTLNGIEFRTNLVVALKNHDNLLFPSYAIIRELVDLDGQVHLLLRLCETVRYDDFLEAYQVEVTDVDNFINIDDIFQHTTFSFWKRLHSGEKFISRRVYNQDY